MKRQVVLRTIYRAADHVESLSNFAGSQVGDAADCIARRLLLRRRLPAANSTSDRPAPQRSGGSQACRQGY